MPQAPSVFDNNAGALRADARGFLRIVWHPNATDAQARRELMMEVLAALTAGGHGKVLADQRYMVPFSPEEQTWVLTYWTPRAVAEGGYRWRAVLAARDVVARLSSATVLTSSRDQISYCYFDNEPEAIAWLQAQK